MGSSFIKNVDLSNQATTDPSSLKERVGFLKSIAEAFIELVWSSQKAGSFFEFLNDCLQKAIRSPAQEQQAANDPQIQTELKLKELYWLFSVQECYFQKFDEKAKNRQKVAKIDDSFENMIAFLNEDTITLEDPEPPVSAPLGGLLAFMESQKFQNKLRACIELTLNLSLNLAQQQFNQILQIWIYNKLMLVLKSITNVIIRPKRYNLDPKIWTGFILNSQKMGSTSQLVISVFEILVRIAKSRMTSSSKLIEYFRFFGSKFLCLFFD